MKNIKIIVIALTAFALIALAGCKMKEKGDTAMDKKGEKGILVVSFGTSYPETRKLTIEACEKRIEKAFPNYEVRRAFTSHMIIKKLKERDGIIIDKTEEALGKMKDSGFSVVIVQPLHIIPGEEYHEKVLKNVLKFKDDFEKLTVGRPILFDEEDYKKSIEALKGQLPDLGKGEAVLFMGHGSHHSGNSAYKRLQGMIDKLGLSVYIGTVEGSPLLNDIIPRLKKDNIKKVTLMPLMLVAGDHATNDMAGDEDDSWNTILKKHGFKVDLYLHGLGENSAFQDIYVQHVKDAIERKTR